MKTLILAAGRGKRLGELSEDKNKCMLLIRGKPLIEYSLDCAIQIDSSEIIIVIGYRGSEIVKCYGQTYYGKQIVYVEQKEQHGLVHAIECAKEAIGKEDFMLMLGDELMINPRHKGMIGLFSAEKLFGVCGVVKVEDMNLVKKTYSVVQSNDEKIIRLIEKPNNPQNNLMGTGNCVFRNDILSYIPKTPINQNRSEKELPDLIQCAIDDGKVVGVFDICDRYVNVNIPDEIEKVESYFAHL
jgi:dTDP-glucose pyrophosphorylase